ncbi:MAG: hypothetical protein HY403_09975 [Elusimicrobia bacterium]|nr:hypothetical protein [Elusimicrobiota bacterium]
MLKIMLVVLLPLAVCVNAFAAAAACQTEDQLRAALARDFPPGSPAVVSVTEVVRASNGAVIVDGLAPSERDFLARALERMGRYGDYGGGRVLMVGFRAAPPRPNAVFSFVQLDAASCARILDRLKIVVNSDGSVTTMLPNYSQP